MNLFTFLKVTVPMVVGFIVNLAFTLGLLYLVYRLFRKLFPSPKAPSAKIELIKNVAWPLAFQLPIAGLWSTGNSEPVLINNPSRGVLITGTAGSGKTKSIVIPLIWQSAALSYSGIQYDYESHVLNRHVYSAFRKSGTVVKDYYINFSDPTRSHRVNPLDPQLMTTSAHAKEYTHSILANLIPESTSKPDFWTRSSESLFSATMWFLKEEYPAYCTLPHAVSLMLTDDIPKLVERLSTNEECAGMVASIKSGLNSSNQTAGILATLQNAVSTINSPSIFWILSGNDFSLDLNDPQHPKFLSISNVPALSDTYSPLASLIISAALKLLNQPDKHHSIVLIDELPTVYIPNLDRIPATARKNKVATVLCIQDFSQLELKYGDKKTEVISSVLVNQFFGKTTNPKTAERISRLYGKVDREYWTESHGSSSQGFLKGSSSQSVSKSIQERPKVGPQDVVNLEQGQFYASIVDFSPHEFKTAFKEVEYEVQEIPEFSKVNEGLMKENYRKIKEDARQILAGVMPKCRLAMENPNPDSDDSEFQPFKDL